MHEYWSRMNIYFVSNWVGNGKKKVKYFLEICCILAVMFRHPIDFTFINKYLLRTVFNHAFPLQIFYNQTITTLLEPTGHIWNTAVKMDPRYCYQTFLDIALPHRIVLLHVAQILASIKQQICHLELATERATMNRTVISASPGHIVELSQTHAVLG